jgi:hypothetical protein
MRVLILTVWTVFTLLAFSYKKYNVDRSWVGSCTMNLDGEDELVQVLKLDTVVVLMRPQMDPYFRQFDPESDPKKYYFGGFELNMTNEENVMLYKIEKNTVTDTIVVFDRETYAETMKIVISEIIDTVSVCSMGKFEWKEE